jgi:hypothetical protein
MAWNIKEGAEQYSRSGRRKVWIFLVGLFAALLLMRLYNWSQGSDSIYRSSAPAAMLLLGVGYLLPSRGLLYYLLSAIGLLLLLVACTVAIFMPSEMFR